MSQQISVLVADADQSFRESITNLLLICGVDQVATTSTLEQAEEKLRTTFFDVILVDLFPPKMKGLQFAKKFQERAPASKVILLIEDRKLPALQKSGRSAASFPAVLKSHLSRTLPQLLREATY